MLLRSVLTVAAATLALGIAAPATAHAAVAEPKPAQQTTTAKADAKPSGVATIAHRGASAYAPENTLAAIRLGIRHKADLVEVDVQQTRDGKLVLMHDTTLARTTDVEERFPSRAPWNVRDFTLEEIRTLDAGSWKAPKYRGERVPTFTEALKVLERSRSGLLLEAKSTQLYPGMDARIARELKLRPWWLLPDPAERRLVVQSFEWDFVERFHRLLPWVKTGALGTPPVEQLPAIAKYADQVNPPHRNATPEYVAAVHARGMTVQPYTVNDPGRMRELIDNGVNGIISDHPDILRAVVEEKNRKNSAPQKAA